MHEVKIMTITIFLILLLILILGICLYAYAIAFRAPKRIPEETYTLPKSQTQIPVLLFHGDDDRFVPCEMSKEIKEANPALVTLELIPKAGHGLCYMVEPKTYEEATVKFIQSILS